MKTGILGGVFDPVHIGHIIPLMNILNNKIVDNIFIIPCKDQPLKNKSITPFEIRFEILKKVFEKYKNIEILDIENKLPSPSYTINTLKELKKEYNNDFYFIIGYDEANQIHKWYKYEELREYTNFILIKRNIKFNNIDYFKNAIKIDNPIIEISSTEIRNMIKNKQCIDYIVPEQAIKIIKDRGLYIE